MKLPAIRQIRFLAGCETAREFLSNTNISQTQTYIRTSTEQMKQAVRKRENSDYADEFEKLFNSVKNNRINKQDFIETNRKLFDK